MNFLNKKNILNMTTTTPYQILENVLSARKIPTSVVCKNNPIKSIAFYLSIDVPIANAKVNMWKKKHKKTEVIKNSIG